MNGYICEFVSSPVFPFTLFRRVDISKLYHVSLIQSACLLFSGCFCGVLEALKKEVLRLIQWLFLWTGQNNNTKHIVRPAGVLQLCGFCLLRSLSS